MENVFLVRIIKQERNELPLSIENSIPILGRRIVHLLHIPNIGEEIRNNCELVNLDIFEVWGVGILDNFKGIRCSV